MRAELKSLVLLAVIFDYLGLASLVRGGVIVTIGGQPRCCSREILARVRALPSLSGRYIFSSWGD